jgi:hypothetical protein
VASLGLGRAPWSRITEHGSAAVAIAVDVTDAAAVQAVACTGSPGHQGFSPP